MLQPAKTDGNTEWFTHDRFGLFIHWGLYALPARHEWVRHNEKITNEQYQKYFKHFDPDLYDPNLWAEAASNAGMKYFVVTTKHHEGFSLWDTSLSDYKATNTPAGKDLLRPMVDAFRAKDMKVGFYHSLLDWYHPHYTIDHIHPLRDDLAARALNSERDLEKYVEFLHGQTRELLSDFGKIDVLWYDFSIAANEWHSGKGKKEWQSEKLIKLIRSLQPEIILNDRLEIDQDIKTPEQFQPRSWVEVDGKPVVWEACQTLSGSWGYHRDEESWKTVDMLVKMLVDSVSKGGNLLLNVGPTGRGEFDYRALDRLQGIGEWMKRHERSIYGCTQAPDGFVAPEDTRYTYNPKTNRLYLHVFSWPFRHIHLEGMADRVEYAQLLNDASEVKMLTKVREAEYGAMKETREGGLLSLEIPIKKPNATVPVIELFLK
ncbi:MAG TPA: alpha-L-fucosidase [Capsulimonadaceae bacterium]|jgi:alpha-L-fucosidase